ncbi:MAG: choice-of-anchor J domain-containing protein [Pseudomonadota bacterium]
MDRACRSLIDRAPNRASATTARPGYRAAAGFAAAALLLALSAAAQAAETVVFSETFGVLDTDPVPYNCNPDFPAGWSRYNEDGLTPAADPKVDWVNAAWVVRENFLHDPLECAAFSTSWYSPAAAADDWLVTPAITIPAINSKLRFRAVAHDPDYPDGYEVRWATTNSVAALSANPPLLTVAAENDSWTSHEIDLSALAGQTVYLAFRNHSYDMFLLALDDIEVVSGVDYDGRLQSVRQPLADLLRVPLIQASPLQLGATVSNKGAFAITNAVVTAHVKLDGSEIHTATAMPIAYLAPDATAEVTMESYTLTQAGGVTVEYRLAIAEADEDTGNNVMTSLDLEVTDEELGADDGAATGEVGSGYGGKIGVTYHLKQASYLRAIRYYTTGTSTELAGDGIVGEIRSMAGIPGKPDALLAQTQPYLVPNPPVAGFVDLPLAEPLLLAPGDYYFGLVEPIADADESDALDLGLSDNIYQPGRNWVGLYGNDWTLLESFTTRNFERAVMVRALFFAHVADLNVTKSAPASIFSGQPLSYTIAVDNAGPDQADEILITEALPAGTTFASASGSGWSCLHNAGIVSCTRPTLAVGSASPITIDLTTPASGTLSSTTTLSSGSVDPDGAATASATTSIYYYDGTTQCLLANCQTGVSAEGNPTVSLNATDPESGQPITLQTEQLSDGTVRHRLTLYGSPNLITGAESLLPGTVTVIEPGDAGLPHIITRATAADGTGYEITAGADGHTAMRLSNTAGLVTKVDLLAPGAWTTLDALGELVTTFAIERDGTSWRAVVTISADGSGTSHFEQWDETDQQWMPYSRTIDPVVPFAPGFHLVVEPDALTGLRLTVQTAVAPLQHF